MTAPEVPTWLRLAAAAVLVAIVGYGAWRRARLERSHAPETATMSTDKQEWAHQPGGVIDYNCVYQPHYTLGGHVSGAVQMMAALDAALRADCHVMLTAPNGAHGYECSIAEAGMDGAIHHGQHASDPLGALWFALTARGPLRAVTDRWAPGACLFYATPGATEQPPFLPDGRMHGTVDSELTAPVEGRGDA